MTNTLAVSFPRGEWLRSFHCPVCGKPIAGSEVTREEHPCPHLDWIYMDNFARFVFVSPSVQTLLDQLEAEAEQAELEAADAETGEKASPDRNEHRPLFDRLQAAWYEPHKAQIAFTTPAVGCGPVPSTVRYGLKFLLD